MPLNADLERFQTGNINDLKELINNHMKEAEKTITPASLAAFAAELSKNRNLSAYVHKCHQYYEASKKTHLQIMKIDALIPSGSLLEGISLLYSTVNNCLTLQEPDTQRVEGSDPFPLRYRDEIESCILKEASTYLGSQSFHPSSSSLEMSYFSSVKELLPLQAHSGFSKVKELYIHTLFSLIFLFPYVDQSKVMQASDFETTNISISTTLKLLKGTLELLHSHAKHHPIRVNGSFFYKKGKKSPFTRCLLNLQKHLIALQETLYEREIVLSKTDSMDKDLQKGVKCFVPSMTDILVESHFKSPNSQRMIQRDDIQGLPSQR